MKLDVPKIDGRSRGDIISEIASLSGSFTPEWNFDPENPDIGGALAIAFGKMMFETIEKYNATPEKNKTEFFAALGAEPLYPEPARGYLSFELPGNSGEAEELVGTGAGFSASGENGESVTFTVKDNVRVVNGGIRNVFCCDFESDKIYPLFSADKGNSSCRFDTVCMPERNLQRHDLYFKSGDFENTDKNAAARVRFEFDNADDASASGFLKYTAEKGIYYGSENGFARCENARLENGELVFGFAENAPLRPSEMFGEYGQWFKLPFDENGTDKARHIYVKNIYAGTSAEDIPADGVFGDTEELTADSFFPFGNSPVPYSSVYFSSAAALCRAGSTVTAEFRSRYVRVPIGGSDESEEIDWKYIMKKSGFKKPKKYDVSIKSVVWEYFSGSGWARLFDDDSYSDVFNGTNDGALIKMSFQCPKNISEIFLPSGKGLAIRARIVSVENYLKTCGDYIVPRTTRPRFSYNYETLPQCDTAVFDNCMKRRLFKAGGDSFRAAERLRGEGKSINFSLSFCPDKEDIKMLFVIRGGCPEKAGKGVWEYLSESGWRLLKCNDETLGLAKTGLLTFGKNEGFSRGADCLIRIRYPAALDYPEKLRLKIYMNCVRAENIQAQGTEYFYVAEGVDTVCRPNNSDIYRVLVSADELSAVSPSEAEELIKTGRAEAAFDENGNISKLWVCRSEATGRPDGKSYVFDRENSRIVFGENGSEIPPASSSENVRITCFTCRGKDGNFPEESEFTPDENQGLISRVFNPLAMSGGFGKESTVKMFGRFAQALKMRSRARTLNDFEAEVRAFDRSVLRVKALEGINASGDEEPGAVSVAVLYKNREDFAERSGLVQKRLSEICCVNMSGKAPAVVKPAVLRCLITAEIFTDGTGSARELQERARLLLENYFDLEKGNYDRKGWEIGSFPDRSEIIGILSNADGASAAGELCMDIFSEDGDELGETEIQRAIRSRLTIPSLIGASVVVKSV